MSVICTGCKTHGTCLDEQAIKIMSSPMVFGTMPEVQDMGNGKMDFELVMQNLLDMVGKEGYREKLHETAAFIMENSRANDPASLRAALNLPASASFASWADETAQKELEFCNTNELKKI